MAKQIKLTQEEKESAILAFSEMLSKAKVVNGKFTYDCPLQNIDETATLWFTPEAYIKKDSLVKNYSGEVGWHGVVERLETNEGNHYLVTDILVYPQEVSAATVNTDQVEYQEWLMQQPDEVFNHIRYQGHSHVNMACTPSTVDRKLYDGITGQLGDDSFYIFEITNKRGENYVEIYDFRKGILFENGDVSIGIALEGLASFIKEAAENVKQFTTKPYTLLTGEKFRKTNPAYGFTHAAIEYLDPDDSVDTAFDAAY